MSDFPVTTADEHRDAILAQLRNLIPGLDTGTGSDAYLKAQALGHVLEGISYRTRWTGQQGFPDEATSANLERHAGLHGLERSG